MYVFINLIINKGARERARERGEGEREIEREDCHLLVVTGEHQKHPSFLTIEQ